MGNGLRFFYDSTGVAGIIYFGGVYHYRKDAQGNVIAIVNSSGGIEVEYAYDAWGNVQVSGTNVGLNNNNPFRYRGYFYDTETGLYYLKNRYYDPVTGRFISPDDLSYLDPDTVNGLNLYAYCGNNPVMKVDTDGNFAISLLLIGFAVGAAVGAGVSVVSQGLENGWDNINWLQVGVDGLLGGINGMLAATGLPMPALAGISAVTSAVSSISSHAIEGDLWSEEALADIFLSAAIGFTAGIVGGNGTLFVKKGFTSSIDMVKLTKIGFKGLTGNLLKSIFKSTAVSVANCFLP